MHTENKTNEQLEKRITDLSDELIKSKNEIKKNWDLFVRAKAEIENIKKRTEKELINIKKYSQKNILIDLLPLLDSLESCLKNENNKNEKNYEGIKLFYKMFIPILDKHHVKKIDITKYTKLNPYKHEVISIIKDKKHDNKIASVFQTGYTLYDQIIRYARVSILKKNDNS